MQPGFVSLQIQGGSPGHSWLSAISIFGSGKKKIAPVPSDIYGGMC